MTRRTERVSEAIREVVSQTILFEMSDPRIQGVTVTKAEVTGDLRHAKVYVSLMGDEKERKLTLAGLKSACGYLQRKVADRLDTRFTPILSIIEDDSVKKSLEMSRLLREVLPPQSTSSEPEVDEEDDISDEDETENPNPSPDIRGDGPEAQSSNESDRSN